MSEGCNLEQNIINFYYQILFLLLLLNQLQIISLLQESYKRRIKDLQTQNQLRIPKAVFNSIYKVYYLMFLDNINGEFEPVIYKKINMFYSSILDPAIFILFAISNFHITRNYQSYNIENIMILAMWEGLSLSYAGLVILGILFGVLYYTCQNDSDLQFFQILSRVICFSTFPFLSLYGACMCISGMYIDILYWRVLFHVFVLSRIGNNLFGWFYENIQRGTSVMHQYIMNSINFRQDQLDTMIPTIDQYNLNAYINQDPMFMFINVVLHIYQVVFMVLVVALKNLDFSPIIETEMIILSSLFFVILAAAIICYIRNIRSGEDLQRSSNLTFIFLLWLILILVIFLIIVDCCLKVDFQNYSLIEPLIITKISMNGQQILLKYFFKQVFQMPENETEQQHFNQLVMQYTNLNSVSSRQKIQCEEKFLFLVNPLCLLMSYALLYATSISIKIQENSLYRIWETILIGSFILWVSLTFKGVYLKKTLVIVMFSEDYNDPHQTISIVWFYIFANFVERIGLKFLLILYSVLIAYLVYDISENVFQPYSMVFPATNLFILLINRICYCYTMQQRHKE